MPKQQLKETLDALHRELESEREISEQDRAALLDAAREIQNALADKDARREDEPLNERVAAMVRDFETSHPKFAEILNNISDALANLGI